MIAALCTLTVTDAAALGLPDLGASAALRACDRDNHP